jgi:hypothetical protein
VIISDHTADVKFYRDQESDVRNQKMLAALRAEEERQTLRRLSFHAAAKPPVTGRLDRGRAPRLDSILFK